MAVEKGSPNYSRFDDSFLDNPSFEDGDQFSSKTYRLLCLTALNRIRLAACNMDTVSQLRLSLEPGSITPQSLWTPDGTAYVPNTVDFRKTEVANRGIAYEYELSGTQPGEGQLRSLLRYAFVTTPEPSAIFLYSSGSPGNDPAWMKEFLHGQQYSFSQLLARQNLPLNESGSMIFSLRLIREFMQGKMKEYGGIYYYHPNPKAKTLAENYNGEAEEALMPKQTETQLLLTDPIENAATWTEAQWADYWAELMQIELEESANELGHRLLTLTTYLKEASDIPPKKRALFEERARQAQAYLEFKIKHRDSISRGHLIALAGVPPQEMDS